MDSLPLLPLLRQALLFAHTLAFAVALGAVLREDLALLSARKVALPRLRAVARLLTRALIALWLTGLGLVVADIGFDAAAIAASPKLTAKLLVVSALTLNGLALHRLAFPALQRAGGALPVLPVLLGAISTASWVVATFIGVSRLVAAQLDLGDYLLLYGLALLTAVAVALWLVRPHRAAGAMRVASDHHGPR